MNHNLVWGPLEISLILLLGGTIFGSAVMLWTRVAEIYPLKLLTGLIAFKGFLYCLVYWHWPMQSLAVFTAADLLWLSWGLWQFRKTKADLFKGPIIAFSVLVIGMLIVGLVAMIREPELLLTLLSHPENYSDAVFLTACIFFSSLNAVILELTERQQAKPV